jgi:hypothetical protein
MGLLWWNDFGFRPLGYMAERIKDEPDLALDDIVTGMRRVIDDLSAAERKLVLTSIRSKWSDIADRLEAPSSRNH